MNVHYLPKNIIHFCFNSQYEACSHLIRLQEFYESPYSNIRGQVFSLEQYMDTYARDNGNFTYFQDWAGFNVPGHIVVRFFLKYWNQLRDKEVAILNKIPLKVLLRQKFYIIGTFNNGDVDHELAHALYYLNDDYANEMVAEIAKIPEKVRQKKITELLNIGYDKPVILDELQAYWVETRTKFRTIFQRYVNAK